MAAESKRWDTKFSTIPIVHTKTKDLMEKVQKSNKEPEKKHSKALSQPGNVLSTVAEIKPSFTLT